MKHKLLPAMIGAALVGGMGAAQADITVFGHLDTSIVNSDTDEGWRFMNKMPKDWYGVGNANSSFHKGISTKDIDDTNFVCTTCSLGFKGKEDLGNGLSVIFKLDFQFDMFKRNKKDNAFFDRDQWVGFAGNFGKVRWGTISTSYKSHGKMLDPLYRTSVQGRTSGLQSFLHAGAGEEGEGRNERAVRWDSPNWNGLKVTASYTLDSNEFDGYNGAGNPKKTEDDNPYAVGAQYTNGGILVFADYLTNNGNQKDNKGGDLSAWKVGGKYKINNFAFMGQYEVIDNNFSDYTSPANGKQEGTWWHVGGSYTMGNNMVYLAYGQSSWENLTPTTTIDKDDLDTTALTLAGTHKLSKRTTIYAAYSTQTQDADLAVSESQPIYGKDVDRDLFGIGMKHKF